MKLIFLWFFMLALFVSFANAQIFFNEGFQDVYNLGEIAELNFSIEKDSSTGYIESYLTCDEDTQLIYKRLLDSGNKQTISLFFKMESTGECKVILKYGDEERESEDFIISQDLILNGSINNKFFYPGEEIRFNGSVKKQNNQKFNGSGEFLLQSLEKQNFLLSNGEINFSYIIPKTLPAGNYFLKFIFSDKEGNFIKFEQEIVIYSIPSKIDINGQEALLPPTNQTIVVILRDQSGKEVSSEKILIRIFDPSNNLMQESLIYSANNYSFFLPTNSSRGTWKANGYYGNLFNSYPFYIQENKQIDFYLDSLTEKIVVENIGNTVYEGTTLLIVTNESGVSQEIPINISLDIGEKLFFSPNSNKGNYSIIADNKSLGIISITGAAISSRNISSSWKIYILFFILCVCLLILIYYLKNKYSKITPLVKKAPLQRKVYVLFFESTNLSQIKELCNKNLYKFQQVNETLGFIVVLGAESGNTVDKLVKIILKCRFVGLAFNASIYLRNYFSTSQTEDVRELVSKARNCLKENKGVILSKEAYQELKEYSSKFIPVLGGEKVINLYKLL